MASPTIPQAMTYDDLAAAVQQQPQYKPLPQLNPATGQASYAGAVTDPIGQFNLNLMSLLQSAQGANRGNATIMAQRNKLQNEQTVNSMAPAADAGLSGLRPGDALNARQDEAGLYNPEIKSLNDRIQLNNEAVDRFTATIKAAKDYGEEIQKYIKPSEQTIEAIRAQVRNGVLPDKDVLAKVQAALTEDDWHAFADAKQGDPVSWKEYLKTDPTPTAAEYNAYQTMDANRKASRNTTNIYGIDKATAAQEARVKQIISVNPNEWGHAAAQIDKEFGAGTATKYDALLKDAYIPKGYG